MMFGAPMTSPSPRQSVRSFATSVLTLIVMPHSTWVGVVGAVGGTGTAAPGPPNTSTSCGNVTSGGSIGISRLMKLWSPPSGSFSTPSRSCQP
jgi:hypothetical protein